MRYRRPIFYFLVLLFPVIGTLTTAYSLGWRIDWETGKVQKIGGISVKTFPRDVIIKINNEIYPDKSGFLQSETLISNLLPKTYRIQISKEGYYPYYKNLKVEPGLVSRLLSVWLIPEKIKYQEVFESRGGKIADASPDASRFIVYNSAKKIFYLYSADAPDQTINLTALLNNIKKMPSLEKIFFVPPRPDNFIMESGGVLKIYKSEDKKIENIDSDITAWTINNDEIYYLKTADSQSAPTVYKFNLISQTSSEIIKLADKKNISSAMLKISSNKKFLGILGADNNFYLLNLSEAGQDNNPLIKIPQEIPLVRDFDFSPDDKKLAVLGKNNNLDIIYLEDFDWEARNKAGDKNKIDLNEPADIGKIFWDNNSLHVFYTSGKSSAPTVKVTEINSQRPINVYKIAENFSDLYYHTNSGAFFIIKNSVLEKMIWQ